MAQNEPAPIAVCDAGPLIHLDELDCLDLLSDWRLWVPDAVWQEIQSRHPHITQLPNAERQMVSAPIPPTLAAISSALSLDAGEPAALVIMQRVLQACF